MRWKRTWNTNSQDKYAGGSVTKLAMLTQPYTHTDKKIMTRARNYNASIESRKTQVKHRSIRTRRTKIKIDFMILIALLHYRPSICPCRIRVENALKTHVIRISFPTRISKIQSKPTFDTRGTAVQRIYLLTNQLLKYNNAVQRTIHVETHCWTANQKGSIALPDLLHVNQW